MGDVVVTVPKSFGLDTWIVEGDAAGEPWSGQEWFFHLGGPVPRMWTGDRVYVVYNNRVRGYAPLVRIDRQGGDRFALVRHLTRLRSQYPRPCAASVAGAIGGGSVKQSSPTRTGNRHDPRSHPHSPLLGSPSLRSFYR